MFTPENSDRDPAFEKVVAQGKPSYDQAAKFAGECPPIITSFSIVSLIFAMISPVVLCVCGFSLPTSFIAILSGHIALSRIKKSAGQLTGRGMALFGLIVGYLMFGISVALLVVFISFIHYESGDANRDRAEENRATTSNASWRLVNAETNVLTDTPGMATGNTDTALGLAMDYSKVMKNMRDVMFIQSDDRLSALTQSNFVTCCELHEDRCAFIVHVPDYGDFDDEARDRLATIAWSVAQGIVEDNLQPGDQLAVGLRGKAVFAVVLIGTVSPPEEDETEFELGERDDLLSFYLRTLPEPARTSVPLQPTDLTPNPAVPSVQEAADPS